MLPIRFYITLLLRRMPLMMAVVLLCSAVAVYAAMTLPPEYSATARLQAEASKITIGLNRDAVETEAAEQFQLIQERLMTRENLLDSARKHQVFDEIDQMTPDEIVDMMQQNTRIFRSSGRNQATLMSITFTASSGVAASGVVNDFTTLVLEENASFRRERAENTLNFFEQETQRLADEIDAQSNQIIEFKRDNVEALPEDLGYRQERQTNLLDRLGRLEQERMAVSNQRAEILSLFEATGRLDSVESPLTPEQQRLQELQQELREGLTIYSETNPRIIFLRNQIRQLEAGMTEQTLPAEEDSAVTGNSFIDITLVEMDQRVGELDNQIKRVTEQLESLNSAIEATATNSITLERLERDLDSIRARYNASLENLNQARMAERVEVNNQGQRISLIESAVAPQSPSGPPRMKIAAAGVGGGIMLAVGLFVLFELLNQKARHPVELQLRFNILPLGVIPYMETRSERLRRRAFMVLACSAVLVAIPVGLYYVHTEFMPLEVLADKILQRVGLV